MTARKSRGASDCPGARWLLGVGVENPRFHGGNRGFSPRWPEPGGRRPPSHGQQSAGAGRRIHVFDLPLEFFQLSAHGRQLTFDTITIEGLGSRLLSGQITD